VRASFALPLTGDAECSLAFEHIGKGCMPSFYQVGKRCVGRQRHIQISWLAASRSLAR